MMSSQLVELEAWSHSSSCLGADQVAPIPSWPDQVAPSCCLGTSQVAPIGKLTNQVAPSSKFGYVPGRTELLGGAKVRTPVHPD